MEKYILRFVTPDSLPWLSKEIILMADYTGEGSIISVGFTIVES